MIHYLAQRKERELRLRMSDSRKKEWSNMSTFSRVFSDGSSSKEDDIFAKGYGTGYEEALRDNPLRSEAVDINNMSDKHKEFYQKFLELAVEYGVAFEYQRDGMKLVERKY